MAYKSTFRVDASCESGADFLYANNAPTLNSAVFDNKDFQCSLP